MGNFPALRIELDAGGQIAPGTWPDSVPAVADLLSHGLDLPIGVTFLVGENGTGKSTVVEAVAEALGIPPGGGSTEHHAGADRGPHDDRSDLAGRLRVVRQAGAMPQGRDGFFLRAETMHRFVTYLAETANLGDGPPASHPLHHVSHGESFVEMLVGGWAHRAGVILLDEPESALSFTSSLALANVLAQMAAAGKHVLCATHSPLLTAIPGARILQLGEDGIATVTWEELEIVGQWRAFLDAPGRYLRHLG